MAKRPSLFTAGVVAGRALADFSMMFRGQFLTFRRGVRFTADGELRAAMERAAAAVEWL